MLSLTVGSFLEVEVTDDGSAYSMCSITYTCYMLEADWVSEDLLSHISHMLIESADIHTEKHAFLFTLFMSVMLRQNHMHILSAVFHYAKITVKGEEACKGEDLRKPTNEDN